MTEVQLYDTTLRDGAQREGISFSAVDKLHIARRLDDLGIHFIEGGWPGSNPKDIEFFNKARSLNLTNSVLVAFGSTRHSRAIAETDIEQGQSVVIESQESEDGLTFKVKPL